MARKPAEARTLLQRRLGKATADALLKKADKMAKEQRPAKTIQKAIEADLSKIMNEAQKVFFVLIPPTT